MAAITPSPNNAVCLTQLLAPRLPPGRAVPATHFLDRDMGEGCTRTWQTHRGWAVEAEAMVWNGWTADGDRVAPPAGVPRREPGNERMSVWLTRGRASGGGGGHHAQP